MPGLLETAATAYGMGAAASALIQARSLVARRSSCDLSLRFFAIYVGGYAVWLAYGISIGSVPLIVVDTVGLATGSVTLGIALTLRGSIVRPGSWASCG